MYASTAVCGASADDMRVACYAGFKSGINWFLDNLWHDASEEPKDKSAILFRYTGSMCKMCKWASLNEVYADSWEQTVKELSITRWLYIDDFLKGEK